MRIPGPPAKVVMLNRSSQKEIAMVRKGQLIDVVGAFAGVGFAVAVFFGVAIIDPLRTATDAELRDWWNDAGNRRGLAASMYMWLLAAPCFLVFVSVLRARLRAGGADGPGTSVVYGAGVVTAALLTVSAIVRGVIAQAVRAGDLPLPGPDTIRFATELHTFAYGVGVMPFATIVIAATSILALRNGVLTRWIGWLGLGVTAVSLALMTAMVGAFATPIILLWILATSAHLFRTRGVGARSMSAGLDPTTVETIAVMPVPR
jgi:hypothetical protein